MTAQTISKTPIYVVIVAGGQGSRMGMALPKQFLTLGDKPILYHTIAAFVKVLPDAHLILVLPAADISKAQMVLQHFSTRIELTIVAGGGSRYESVQNGLKGLPEASIILVHDGVRPFVGAKLIHNCIASAEALGAAIPAVPIVDSIRQVEGSHSMPIDRTSLRAIQTPQAFQGSWLLPAFEQPYQVSFTDEASVIEAMGYKVSLIDGERFNIKITTPEDMVFAESILPIWDTNEK